jgi:hypothetical protein
MFLRPVLLAVLVLAAVPAAAQESPADAALRRVPENRAARAADQAERASALSDRIRGDIGRDEGDQGVRSGSSFEQGERAQRAIERQVSREAVGRQQRLDQPQSVQSRLIPQGAPLGPVTPMQTTGRRVLDLRDPAVAERFRQAWRADARFDWRRLRVREPFRFRIGLRDAGQAPPRLGQVIASAPTSAWLRDPWVLHLPPLAGPYRWIRVGRAAVLLDRRTNRVVDVVPDLFLAER